ncbi:hypothetical protein AN403_5089 [Pseudomonas fluorescens]|uniref:Uncharacterized protein n=1 Tax=Pseudomonas fluorescens TaxID=294 RepID=A0A0P8XKW1_PSEFL|nr:hypothetical protein AN403_5089 [Pseudomonas fluorescens]
MGGSDHHGLSVALSESGALQALLFLSNPSSQCGYYDKKQRHLTRLVRRSSFLIAPPLCLKSTRASFAFAIKTSRSRNGNKQPFCFVERSARSAANGACVGVLSVQDVFGKGRLQAQVIVEGLCRSE